MLKCVFNYVVQSFLYCEKEVWTTDCVFKVLFVNKIEKEQTK